MRVRILVVVAAVLAAFLVAPATPALALDGVQVVRVVTGNDSVDTKDHVAECPRDTVTVGGGARISGQGEPYVHITSIGPLFEHGWFAVAREYRPGTGHAWALTVWAICAEPPPGLDYVSVTGFSQSVPSQAVTAPCKEGTRVIAGGGGIYAEDDGGVDVDGEAMLAEMRPNIALDGVWARGVEDFLGTPGMWTITAYAICASVDSYLAPWGSASNTISPKAAGAGCRAGYDPNGLGFWIYAPDGTVAVNDLMFPVPGMGAVSAYELPLGQPAGTPWFIGGYTICVA